VFFAVQAGLAAAQGQLILRAYVEWAAALHPSRAGLEAVKLSLRLTGLRSRDGFAVAHCA
jgi:hypothetical protein